MSPTRPVLYHCSDEIFPLSLISKICLCHSVQFSKSLSSKGRNAVVVSEIIFFKKHNYIDHTHNSMPCSIIPKCFKHTLVKIRGVPQGRVISPTLFIIFIDGICDQLSSHIPRALHADDLALWTEAEQVTTAAIRMQEAMKLISDWVEERLVMINRTKTEATCFSLSPKREEFIQQINEREIHQQDTPTYLGVTLDRKVTWSPHISTMHS